MDAAPGDVLADRYRLKAVLGRGGMGVVWLAGDELLHREVALKEVIWPPQLDAAERETLRQRALREARTAARLDHPNIVGVYDVVESDGRPWIVMQLVRYRSLSDAVRDDGPLPPARAAHVGLQILEALRAAHSAGVLHRDVKPGNVLLGPEDRVVLTDFGMAVADGSTTLTTSGTLIGSPFYMAPERARGLPGTPAADLWSLGATLYAAVEGRPPFDREGSMAILTAVVSDDPDPPARAGPLWPVISGLLRKNPAERLDAAEAERMLRRIASHGAGSRLLLEQATSPLSEIVPAAGGRGANGGPPARAQEAKPRPQPQQPAPGAGRRAAAATAGLVTEPAVPAREPPPPRRPGNGIPPRRSPRKWWLLGVAAGLAVVVAATVTAMNLASGNTPGHRAASQGSRRPAPHQHHGASTPEGSQPAAPRPSASGPANPGSGESARLPAGYVRYHDPTGFSIGMPKGWLVSHQGHLVYIQDPSGSRFLIIDQTTHPKPDPLADWRQQEAARISTYPGYHRIRLQAVNYPQAERAADWEFTYDQHGQLTHVLNRNILVDAHHAYALYWSTPASEWAASYHIFQAFAATFRPVVSAPRGS